MSYDTSLGKFLSLILRHRPETIGITLDHAGWADVEELINGITRYGKKIDKKTLERIVLENDKQRYSFNEDKTKIRANQGHSISVELGLKKQTPPPILYHGTAISSLESIKKRGILKQSRQYVHLSKDEKTAISVGVRHGFPVVLVIDTQAMLADGFVFYLSDNGVWLCEQVPFKYIKEERKIKK